MGKACEKQNDLAECHMAITPNQMLCEEGMERIQYFQKYGEYASIFLSKRNMNTRTQAYRKKQKVVPIILQQFPVGDGKQRTVTVLPDVRFIICFSSIKRAIQRCALRNVIHWNKQRLCVASHAEKPEFESHSFFFFLAVLHVLWNLSSPDQGLNSGHVSGSLES